MNPDRVQKLELHRAEMLSVADDVIAKADARIRVIEAYLRDGWSVSYSQVKIYEGHLASAARAARAARAAKRALQRRYRKPLFATRKAAA